MEQCSQVARLQLVEIGDDASQFRQELGPDSRPCEPLELLPCPLPAHRAGPETFVVRLLGRQGRAAEELDAHPAGVLRGEAGGQVGRRVNLDLPQQPLNIGSRDPFGRELLGHHLPIQERDRQQVGKRVVGLLFRADFLLCAFLAAADDVVGDLERLQLDALDLGWVERVCLA